MFRLREVTSSLSTPSPCSSCRSRQHRYEVAASQALPPTELVYPRFGHPFEEKYFIYASSACSTVGSRRWILAGEVAVDCADAFGLYLASEVSSARTIGWECTLHQGPSAPGRTGGIPGGVAGIEAGDDTNRATQTTESVHTFALLSRDSVPGPAGGRSPVGMKVTRKRTGGKTHRS